MVHAKLFAIHVAHLTEGHAGAHGLHQHGHEIPAVLARGTHVRESGRGRLLVASLLEGPHLGRLPLLDRGIDAQYFQPRTLWPMLDETIDFINQCDVVYVVDLNAEAQLAGLFIRQGAEATRIRKLLHYDGTPIRSDAVVEFVVRDQEKDLDVGEVA